MRTAWDFVENTGKSIFLTGKAGTGKTTFLKAVKDFSTKRVVVVAPTGIAAINAGGVTIHSFFQLPLSPFVPNATLKSRFDFSKEKRKIISTIDLLVIDEVSMVRSDLLDAIDSVLRRFREHDKPFGGVQLLMIGDLNQLTPVVTPEDEELLRPYYDTPYFFGSHALQLIDYVTIQLHQVYRQQDEKFLAILNHVRDGQVTDNDLSLLNGRVGLPPKDGDYIRLTTHNYKADSYNESELRELPTHAVNYRAKIEGTFPEFSYPTSMTMTLKVGAQVMFIKNDPSGEHLYYNGRIGKVTYLDDSHVFVLCPGDENAIDVVPQEWENARYILNEKTREIETEVLGTFRQLPLRLAWAITIHKSQGLTFDHAVIEADRSFAPGQVYVALSRCRTLEGMLLATPLRRSAIIRDERVETYIGRQQEEAQASISRLDDMKEEYHRRLLVELFTFRDVLQAEEALARVFIEYFQRSYAQTTTLHQQTLNSMRSSVAVVAEKWIAQIQHKSVSELHAPDFLERVRRSAAYFEEQLQTLFGHLIERSKGVETNNKTAKKRHQVSLDELELAYRSRRLLLGRMKTQAFDVKTYLKIKQLTLLEALDEASPGKKKRERKNRSTTDIKKSASTKSSKEKTQDVTFRMYRQGMTPELIAKERGLTMTTVYSHLSNFVAQGVLPLSDFVDNDKVVAIQLAVAQAGQNSPLTAVKLLCPPDVTWEELHMVMHRKKE